MNLHEAQRLARQLMDKHGLADWSFRFDRSRKRFGMCAAARRLISMSAYLTHLNSEAKVRDTILHEIAHALEPGDGHGTRWKARCLALGAKPVRCYSSAEIVTPPQPSAAYSIGCTTCQWWSDRRRILGRRLICRRCGSDVQYLHRASGTRFVIEVAPRGWRTRVVPGASSKPEYTGQRYS